MNSKKILVVAVLLVFMIAIAIYMGNWAVESNPDGLTLHSPSDEEANEARSAFSSGASFGLLGISLLYFLLAVGVFLSNKIRKIPAGNMPLTIALIAALGISASYLVDGYFF